MRSLLLYKQVRCVLFCLFLMPGICAIGQPGFITAGKLRVHYKQQGAGKPVVFLHAGFQDMGIWDKQVAYFRQHHTVITIDLPGHGATTGVDTALLIQDVLRICLDSLHIQKASFVGLSLGAACATDFVLAYPQRVDRLVLTSSGLSGWRAVLKLDSLSRQCFEQQDKAMESANKDSIAACFTRTWCSGPFRKPDAVNADARDYIFRTTLHTLQQHNGYSDWPRFATPEAALRMKSLSVPLLIIDGDKDIPLIITEADWIHHTVKGAELVTFNGVAHMLNLEIPDEYNRVVGRFLDR